MAPHRILQSGVVPCRRRAGGLEVLLVTSRATGAWIVPNGAVEPDLTPLASACKEGWEEAGVRGTAAPDPVGRFAYDRNGVPCDVDLYVLRVESTVDDFPEAGQRRRAWMPWDRAAEAVENPQLRDLLRCLPAAVAALEPPFLM